MSHRGETLTFERVKKELETELKKKDNNMSKWNLQEYVKRAEEQNKIAEQQQEKNVFGAMLGDTIGLIADIYASKYGGKVQRRPSKAAEEIKRLNEIREMHRKQLQDAVMEQSAEQVKQQQYKEKAEALQQHRNAILQIQREKAEALQQYRNENLQMQREKADALQQYREQQLQKKEQKTQKKRTTKKKKNKKKTKTKTEKKPTTKKKNFLQKSKKGIFQKK